MDDADQGAGSQPENVPRRAQAPRERRRRTDHITSVRRARRLGVRLPLGSQGIHRPSRAVQGHHHLVHRPRRGKRFASPGRGRGGSDAGRCWSASSHAGRRDDAGRSRARRVPKGICRYAGRARGASTRPERRYRIRRREQDHRQRHAARPNQHRRANAGRYACSANRARVRFIDRRQRPASGSMEVGAVRKKG